jgi:hypothetical protein
VISPLQYGIDAAESVLALLRNAEAFTADRLLTPLRNWLAFEAEIARMVNKLPARVSDSIITLGGEDERILWELWHGGCPDDLSARVQHIYLRPIPTPGDKPWEEFALTVRTDRESLRAYLRRRTETDGHTGLVEWVLKTAVRLPASLNPGFRDRLDPVLTDVDALLRAPVTELSRSLGAVANAVVEWFTA